MREPGVEPGSLRFCEQVLKRTLNLHRSWQRNILTTILLTPVVVYRTLFLKIWSQQGSNLRPFRCKRNVLPLNYGTVKTTKSFLY